ncbi:homeobox-containing protein 1 isoform X2 [Polypterus senegalus]|uniref:homeobox-containing protein 1 isoform X2 n=1 Tax=Polypterus senegalus TaxID=55291 RepID=UPI001963307F|nr:homeobox-containing protein 1 isoform X2 [Polypterus senegalus]
MKSGIQFSPGLDLITAKPGTKMEYCTEEPRYTIEQIDLLQRLRLTGMTKPQIIHALDSLERLSKDHSYKFQQQPPTQCCTRFKSACTISSPHLITAATQTHSIADSLSQRHCFEFLAPNLYPTNGSHKSLGYDLGEEEWDIEVKVEDYMRRDSNVVKEEIKVFLNNRRISQAIVGQVTGISQSYISQWLLQQGLEMSDAKKRAFYRWYLLERNRPGATLSLRPLCGALKEEPEWRTSGSPAGGGTSLRMRRGSRFTWRKECLVVMERFFADNQYPDESRREEIAEVCNTVIEKTEAAILESHGIDAHSPSCQSNEEEINGTDFGDQAEEEDITECESQQQPVLIHPDTAVHSSAVQQAKQHGEQLKREDADEK